MPPAPSTTATPALTVGLVGSGFRARAFLQLATRVPSVFGITGVVTRSSASGVALTDRAPWHRVNRPKVVPHYSP